MSSVPLTGPHPLASVMLYASDVPAACVKMPVVLVTPSNVYDNVPVPPVAAIVTVAVPPLQAIGVVTPALLSWMLAASLISIVPLTGPHPLASVILYASDVPAACVKMPVVLVTPSNVYDNVPV